MLCFLYRSNNCLLVALSYPNSCIGDMTSAFPACILVWLETRASHSGPTIVDIRSSRLVVESLSHPSASPHNFLSG
ncbi:hypothetical protein KVT40_001818 [Elsinoe batatas]|uniref:Uncharacterized protein n=1 Tax=Elsinoe batatas TaxID=2601811 RepID=A0A8K0L5P8_9PEZI|nr:hypothetical protein KVT40_001818 [Elsinoe batatas]